MRAAVATLPGAVRRVAEYACGWCDADANATTSSSGKALRPTCALLVADALGGDYEAAVPAAVAVELAQNSTLLHDDVMDGDLLRRHRPTAWSVFGVGPAILAGDALLTLAFDTLLTVGGEEGRTAARHLSVAVQELIAAQSADLEFEGRVDASLEACVSMLRGKSSPLAGCSCALGAHFATGDTERIERVRAFGEHLAFAFQLGNDIEGIWGAPALTGKVAHADLNARKMSAPVVAALRSGTPAGHELAAYYVGTAELSAEDVARMATLVDAGGGRAWAEAEAGRQVSVALHALRAATPGGAAAAELETIARLALPDRR
jgi:geranylgeranyl diphosphate synthase type I